METRYKAMRNALSSDIEDDDENVDVENMYYVHRFGQKSVKEIIKTNLAPSSIICERFLTSISNTKMYDKRAAFIEHLQGNNKQFQRLIKAYNAFENATTTESEVQAMVRTTTIPTKIHQFLTIRCIFF